MFGKQFHNIEGFPAYGGLDFDLVEEKIYRILDELKLEKPKTKVMNEILSKFFKDKSGLVVIPKKEDNAIKSARNIKKVGIMEAREINPLDLLNYKYLLMPKDSVKVIKDTFLK